MPKSTSHDPERIAGILRKSHEKLASSMHADSPTHHVMAGFSDAYRAWLESVSAKPQTLLDLHAAIFDRFIRYHMLAASFRGRAVMEDHTALFSLAMQRDAERCVERLTSHIRSGVDYVLSTGQI